MEDLVLQLRDLFDLLVLLDLHLEKPNGKALIHLRMTLFTALFASIRLKSTYFYSILSIFMSPFSRKYFKDRPRNMPLVKIDLIIISTLLHLPIRHVNILYNLIFLYFFNTFLIILQ